LAMSCGKTVSDGRGTVYCKKRRESKAKSTPFRAPAEERQLLHPKKTESAMKKGIFNKWVFKKRNEMEGGKIRGKSNRRNFKVSRPLSRILGKKPKRPEGLVFPNRKSIVKDCTIARKGVFKGG